MGRAPHAATRDLDSRVAARRSRLGSAGQSFGRHSRAFLLAARSPKFLDAHLRQLGPLAFFLPQSAPERAWFAAVSVSAGICEELVFRGFLIQYFAHPPLHFPAWLAVVAAAVVFGVDHGYQGVGGILTTTVLGLIFALLFILTGHLWVVMVLHATIDLRIVWLLWLGRAQWPPGRGTS